MQELLTWLLEQVPVIIVMGIVIYGQYKEKKDLLDRLQRQTDYMMARDKETIKLLEGMETVLSNLSNANVTKSDLESLESNIKAELALIKERMK